MHPSTLLSGKIPPIPLDYMLWCMILGARCRDFLSCRGQPLWGNGRVAVADIMTSDDIILWIWFSLRPPRWDLTIRHGHCVKNCSLRFCRNGTELDLGECRSPTPIFQENQLPPSHQLWVYGCEFVLRLMVMMAMVLMAMVMMAIVMMMIVMVSVMIVIILPEALVQAGWLCQH